MPDGPSYAREMSAKPANTSLGADVWRLMTDFTLDQYAKRVNASELPQGIGAHLMALSEHEPRPMGWLAAHFGIDASTATWMVDRLEQRGFAERRAMEGDRRVRTVVLTPLGARTKARLEQMLYEAPPELLRLDESVLEPLRGVLLAAQAASAEASAGPSANGGGRTQRKASKTGRS